MNKPISPSWPNSANNKKEITMIIDLTCPECGHKFQDDKQPPGEETSKTGPSMFTCPNCYYSVVDVRPVEISDPELSPPNSPRSPQTLAPLMGQTPGTWIPANTDPDNPITPNPTTSESEIGTGPDPGTYDLIGHNSPKIPHIFTPGTGPDDGDTLG
jgi:hypothetical protein